VARRRRQRILPPSSARGTRSLFLGLMPQATRCRRFAAQDFWPATPHQFDVRRQAPPGTLPRFLHEKPRTPPTAALRWRT